MKNMVNRNRIKKVQSTFILPDGSVTENRSLISEKFNDFFINIGPNSAKKIPDLGMTPLNHMGPSAAHAIFLSQVTNIEIIQIIQDLKNDAPGYDEISASALTLVSCHVVVPLVYLCNLSIEQGVFPRELKLANGLPLYKTDDPFLFNNYRPVSLLSILSKVFEKIMYYRLIEYLEAYKIIINNQFGFRKNHSSYMALMVFMNELITSLENGKIVVGVFLDFSEAFDTVDHHILLSKLEHYGIRGNALSWFRNYLTDRKQYVTYNGSTSPTKSIRCGVPQGSILGPLLFLIYINDLYLVCNHCTPILFADDTNLFISGVDIDHMQNILNDELHHISQWLMTNKLSLNVKKTHYMVIIKKRIARSGMMIKINGQAISEVSKTKFWGVIIDNKINWKDHISYIAGKVSRGIGMMIKARKYLQKEALLTLYYTFIYPYFTYCNHIWGATYISNLNKLIKLQNAVLRIMCNVKRLGSFTALYEKLGIFRLIDINKYLIGRFMFRFCNNQVPVLFDSFFAHNYEFHAYNTRSAQHFHIPPVKTNLGKTGIRYRGALIWNEIISKGVPSDTSECIFVKFIKKIFMVQWTFSNWYW